MTEAEGANPYPGLRPFETEEDYLFFGRDGQSQDILARLRRNRLVAVVGSSGSGKSSLIRAGLLPYLFGGFMAGASSHWRVALMRPGGDPIRNLARTLNDPAVLSDPAATDDDSQQNATLLEVTLRRSGLGLIEATQQAHLPEHDNLLVVVDQFEELFRFAEPAKSLRKEDDAAAFVKLLLEATAQSDLPIYVVITMRSDFIGDCARYRDLPESVAAGLYLIPRMTRDQRREAIERPARVGESEISRRLVNRLLNDGGDNPDQLPILQHALMRTWEHWRQHHRDGEPVDLEDYKAIGEMTDALSRHAEEAYAELPDDRARYIAKRLFQALTEKGEDNREIRRPTRVETVAAIAGASVPEVVSIVESFRKPGRSFLTPPADVPLHAETMIDISHESLIRGWTRLNKWVDEETESARVYQRLADTAALHAQGRAGLWNDPDLSDALTWRGKENPNADWGHRYHPGFQAAMAFLERSAAARDAAQAEQARLRREAVRNRVAIVAGMAICLALLGLGWFKSYRKRMRHEAAEQEQMKLADTKAQLAQANAAAAVANAQLEKTKNQLEETLIQQSLQETEWVRDVARSADVQRVENTSATETLGSRLIDLVPAPQQIRWHTLRGSALSEIGEHAKAADAYTAALRLQPENRSIQAERGYEYILLGRAEDAIADLSAYLETNPNSWLQHLNLAVALAMQKRYADAEAQTRLGMQNFQLVTSGLFDSEVSPDITRATGQRIVRASPLTFYVTMFYEIASLRAFAGEPGFTSALQQADAVAAREGFYSPSSTKPGESHGSVDPFLLGIEWAWLDARAQSGNHSDYGVYAAYGALWERAGRIQPRFTDWAGHFYVKFQETHAERRDPRYDRLATWVAQRLHALYPGSGKPPDLPPQKPTDPRALAIEAEAVKDRDDYAGSAQVLSDAIHQIEHDPAERTQLAELLLKRAEMYLDASDFAAAHKDCERVLRLVPHTATAYYYLGNSENDDPAKIRDYELALKYDPDLRWVKTNLAYIIEGKDPRRALDLLQSANRIDSPDADISLEIASLENKLGNYPAALASVNQAIALKPDTLSYYDTQDAIEKNLGRDATQRLLDKAAGYRAVGDFMARGGKVERALDIYMRALRMLADAPDAKGNPDVTAEATVVARDVSRMLERIASRQDARLFWLTAGEATYLVPLSDIAKREVQRLSSP